MAANNFDGKIETLTTEVNNLKGEVKSLTTEVNKLDGEIKAFTTEFNNSDREFEALTTEFNNFHGEVEAYMALLKNLDTLVEQTEKMFRESRLKLFKTKSYAEAPRFPYVPKPCHQPSYQPYESNYGSLYGMNPYSPYQPYENSFNYGLYGLNPYSYRRPQSSWLELDPMDKQVFDRNLPIDDYIDWIIEVGGFFHFLESPEVKQEEFVVWWEGLQSRRKLMGRRPLKVWPKLRKVITALHYDNTIRS